MKYYTPTSQRIDLDARQMYFCVMNRQGKKLVTGIEMRFLAGMLFPY
jgi:hypothetical protein